MYNNIENSKLITMLMNYKVFCFIRLLLHIVEIKLFQLRQIENILINISKQKRYKQFYKIALFSNVIRNEIKSKKNIFKQTVQ